MIVLGDASCWRFEAACLALVSVVLFVGYKFKKRLSYFHERGFPTLPFVKTVRLSFGLFTFRMNFIEFLDEIYKHFEGHDIGGFFQLGTNNLIVRDPAAVNKIKIKDFSCFQDHGIEVDTDVNPLEGHLFHMNGPKWRAMRNKLTPTFTTGKLKGMLPQMADCSDNLVSVLRQTKPDEDVLVHDILSRFTMDVIGSCAFGIEAGALKDPNCEFIRMTRKIFRPGWVQQWKALFRIAFPQMAVKLKMKTMDEEASAFFLDITRQAFEHRMKTGLKRNDFVDLLLQLKLKGTVDCDPQDVAEEEDISPGMAPCSTEEEPEKLVLTDGLLAAQSFAFLGAGLENTASTIAFTLYFLAKHPDAQDKVRRELRKAKQKHGDRITYEAMKEMVYLEACISESMRMFTLAIGLIQSCTKSCTLEDGRVIEKGTTIWIPVSAMHRDPVHFPDPEEFKPERFMTGTAPPSVYMPFGSGPRICIARRFVLIEVKEVVAKLLDNFRITLSPKTKEPIKFAPKVFVIEPEGGLWLRIQSLNDSTE